MGTHIFPYVFYATVRAVCDFLDGRDCIGKDACLQYIRLRAFCNELVWHPQVQIDYNLLRSFFCYVCFKFHSKFGKLSFYVQLSSEIVHTKKAY